MSATADENLTRDMQAARDAYPRFHSSPLLVHSDAGNAWLAAYASALSDKRSEQERLAKEFTDRAEWLRSEYLNGGNFEHLNAREQECRYLAQKLSEGPVPRDELREMLDEAVPHLRKLAHACEACEGAGEILTHATDQAEACKHCKPIWDLIERIDPPKPSKPVAPPPVATDADYDDDLPF